MVSSIRHRYLTYSLFTLFVTVTTIALPLAHFAHTLRHFTLVNTTVADLKLIGAHVDTLPDESVLARIAVRLRFTSEPSTIECIHVSTAQLPSVARCVGDRRLAVREVYIEDDNAFGSHEITSDDFERILNCKDIERLSLSVHSLKPELLCCIARCPDVRALSLMVRRLENVHLSYLPPMYKLTYISFVCSKVTDDFVSYIPPLPSLDEINLGATAVTARGVQKLESKLGRHVEIVGSRVPDFDEAVKNVTTQSHMSDHCLHVTGHIVDDDLMSQCLQSYEGFTCIDLSNSCVRGTCFDHYTGRDAIETLYLSNTLVDNSTVDNTIYLPRLRIVDLSGTAITQLSVRDGLSASLEQLNLTRCAVGDSSYGAISKMTSLKVLRISATLFTGRTAARLAKELMLDVLVVSEGVLSPMEIDELKPTIVLED